MTEETLKAHTVAHSLCLQTQAGLATAVPVQKKQTKKTNKDLFGVLMLFYFYTGVYGGDHDKPTVAYCAIISEWNATETLILCVYIGLDNTKIFPALC